MAPRKKSPERLVNAMRELTVDTVPKSQVLCMKPEHKPEFSDRRVAVAYELKALAQKFCELANEAGKEGLDVTFAPYYQGPETGWGVNVRVAVPLLK